MKWNDGWMFGSGTVLAGVLTALALMFFPDAAWLFAALAVAFTIGVVAWALEEYADPESLRVMGLIDMAGPVAIMLPGYAAGQVTVYTGTPWWVPVVTLFAICALWMMVALYRHRREEREIRVDGGRDSQARG